MKDYRVSGFTEEAGAAQVDIEATTKEEAEIIARKDYDFTKVIDVTEL